MNYRVKLYNDKGKRSHMCIEKISLIFQIHSTERQNHATCQSKKLSRCIAALIKGSRIFSSIPIRKNHKRISCCLEEQIFIYIHAQACFMNRCFSSLTEGGSRFASSVSPTRTPANTRRYINSLFRNRGICSLSYTHSHTRARR